MIDWLAWAKMAQPFVTSLCGHFVGKRPEMNFLPESDGVKLHIRNPRADTIVIEDVEASPSVLGFATGNEVDDLTRTILHQRRVPIEEALATMSPGSDLRLGVVTFDPFNQSAPDQIIKVTTHWRSVNHSVREKRKVSCKTTVRAIRDLKLDAERRRPRLWVV